MFITPKTDWDTNPKSPMAEDFNRIEGNIDFLNTDIETKKGAIVDAINAMGQSVTIADTFAILAAKIKAISTDANAAVGDVLAGKTFYQGGVKRTGIIPSKGVATITPGTANQVITAGQYLSGAQTILGDPDLVAGNIKVGVELFGKIGTFNPNAVTASDNWVLIDNANDYTGDLSYIKIKEIKINVSGRVRVSYGINASTGGSGYARIYINGVAVGPERYSNSTTPTIYTEDYDVNPGDLIQLYARRQSGNMGSNLMQLGLNINGLAGIGAVNNVF